MLEKLPPEKLQDWPWPKLFRFFKQYPECADDPAYAGLLERPLGTRSVYDNRPKPSGVSPLSASSEPKKSSRGKSSEAIFRRLTREHYERLGGMYLKADSYNHMTMRSADMGGVFDAIAVVPDLGTVGVQLTSRANLPARLKKMRESKVAERWLALGNRIHVIGWYKDPGGRWAAKIESLGGGN